MSDDDIEADFARRMRGDERVARELDEHRRKHDATAMMMDEIDDSDDTSSDDDAPLARRPTIGGRGRGTSTDRTSMAGGHKEDEADGGRGRGSGAGGAGGKEAEHRRAGRHSGADHHFDSDSSGEGDTESRARIMSEFGRATARGGADSAAGGAGGSGVEIDDQGRNFAVNPSSMRTYLNRPIRPGEGPIECYCDRKKSALSKPIWFFFLESEGRFMCASQKRSGNKTSNYLIAMSKDPADRRSDVVVGKVRANFTGSGYTLYDQGMSPEKAVTDSSLRKELAVIYFDYDKMGPGKMRVAIPRVNDVGTAAVFKPREDKDGLEAADAKKDTERVMVLQNKRPKWDDTIGGHVLNFRGRVTKSSVKNFQLACDETGDDTVLQFGRIGPNRFNMDYQYPLSPVQAVGIVLASLDGKMADSKTFDKMKGWKAGAKGLFKRGKK